MTTTDVHTANEPKPAVKILTDALTRPCPRCDAKPGDPCVSEHGNRLDYAHAGRCKPTTQGKAKPENAKPEPKPKAAKKRTVELPTGRALILQCLSPRQAALAIKMPDDAKGIGSSMSGATRGGYVTRVDTKGIHVADNFTGPTDVTMTWKQVVACLFDAHVSRRETLLAAAEAAGKHRVQYPVFKASKEAQGCGFPKPGEPLTPGQEAMKRDREAYEPVREAWQVEQDRLVAAEREAFEHLWDTVNVFVLDGVEYVLP